MQSKMSNVRNEAENEEKYEERRAEGGEGGGEGNVSLDLCTREGILCRAQLVAAAVVQDASESSPSARGSENDPVSQ